jgi:enamine deaminase RidA (YjgF/YER057c/UK114 family)
MPIQRLNPPTLSKPTGYSHATLVTAGRQLHISGQVALNVAGEIVGKGDLAVQADQVYQNLLAALAAAGADMRHVFKIVTYVVDLDPARAADIRKVRLRYLAEGEYPASTMVGTTALVHPDLLIEIEAIALLDAA